MNQYIALLTWKYSLCHQCLGNHEFDLGVEGLVPYLDNLTVPVLDANIDVSDEPRLQGKFNSTLILERGGEKIGIVGFITKDTAFISSAGRDAHLYLSFRAYTIYVQNIRQQYALNGRSFNFR